MSTSLESQLHAALAREARLRKALEECEHEATELRLDDSNRAVPRYSRRCYWCGFDGPHEDLNDMRHSAECPFAALTPSPLADAAAEVLGAAMDYPEHEVRRLRTATTHYRALLRGGAEGGEEE